MARLSNREIDESWDRAGYGYDPEDEDLLRHVLLDDEPPQGLHRGGYKPHCERAGEHFFEPLGYGECVYCHKTRSEIDCR